MGTTDDDELEFAVSVESATRESFEVTVRVRADATASADEMRMETITLAAGTSQRIAVEAPSHLGKRLEFQVGASARPGVPAFYTRWQSTTIEPVK